MAGILLPVCSTPTGGHRYFGQGLPDEATRQALAQAFARLDARLS